MATITKITTPSKTPNRRHVYIDGKLALKCNVTVVARYRLHVNKALSDRDLSDLRIGETRQSCFDHALRFIQRRPHSRTQLRAKLGRKFGSAAFVEPVLDDLARLGYLDDAKFATSQAGFSAVRKLHGPRRALADLARAGVAPAVARQAVQKVFEKADSLAVAERLVSRKLAALRKLEPQVARRRLVGMLARRGFDFETIRPIVERALGGGQDEG